MDTNDLDAVCPYCGTATDAITSLTSKSLPQPGDVSVCIYCAGIWQFDDRLQPRDPDDDVLTDRGVLAAQKVAKERIHRGH